MSIDERGSKSWQLIERLLAACQTECKRHGATLAVVYHGCRPEIEAAAGRAPYIPLSREKDPYCLDERIFEMGRDFLQPLTGRLGIPFLDLTVALKAKVTETGRAHNFPDNAHYNELGHATAGEAMAEWVESLLDDGVLAF